MKIVVTGACGQLGRSIGKVAVEYPEHEFVFTDLPEADITDRESMRRIIEYHSPDALINCAAYTDVERAEREPEAALRLNAAGPEVLASLAVEYGFRLVHISTDYVFDGKSQNAYKETDATAPLNVYGVTKLAGERAIELSGADAVVVRSSWLFSEFGLNFVKTMLRLAAGSTDIIKVVDDQTGSPTYAADLARAVIELSGSEQRFKLCHYCGEGAVTWYGFAQKIFSLAGVSPNLVAVGSAEYPSAVVRPAHSLLDTSLARQAGLDIRPWEEGLEEVIRIIMNYEYKL